MKRNGEDLDKTIYNICSVIYGLCKLNLEFIGTLNNSFQLINSKMPVIINNCKTKTFTSIHDALKNKESAEVLYYTDNFQLSYLSVGFFDKSKYKGTIIVGPFLSEVPDDTLLTKVVDENNLSLAYKLRLHDYYKTLYIYDFNEIRNVGSLLINFSSNPFISSDIVYFQTETPNLKKEIDDINKEDLISEIELRYTVEKKLLNAVMKGLEKEALEFINLFKFEVVHRVPNNPLRAHKNSLFALNTLLRTACERGGVSPIYIHSWSDKFAILIENVSNLAQLEKLMASMISEYCNLVNIYSTAGYSTIVKKAINYINLNFKNPISLSLIADSININSSHLSRKFKKETHMTVTDFINKKRIKDAEFLIEQNNNSITEIALIVGFQNHNYFCKVFKQVTSLTPKDYLKKISLKSK